jgi:hypothetical protein
MLNEYVHERMHRVMSTNVSPSGLYVHRTFEAGLRDLQFGREERFVQLEFELPGTSEVIWARGEVRYDALPTKLVHGTGIQITDIARAHARLLRDYVIDLKRSRLQKLLDRIAGNRMTLSPAF